MCIRINGDINDVAEMYLDNELRSIKSFLEEVLDLPGRPTINELLGAVKHELHEDEEVETKEKSVLYLYDHSGITMSTGSFCDSWDSGQVGFIYVTKEDIEKEYGAFKESRNGYERASGRSRYL